MTRLHRSKIAHLDESMACRFEDTTLDCSLPYEKIFTSFPIISPSEEVCDKLEHGLKFDNTLGLEPGKKYLVMKDKKYISLIEDRDGEVRICANNLE